MRNQISILTTTEALLAVSKRASFPPFDGGLSENGLLDVVREHQIEVPLVLERTDEEGLNAAHSFHGSHGSHHSHHSHHSGR